MGRGFAAAIWFGVFFCGIAAAAQPPSAPAPASQVQLSKLQQRILTLIKLDLQMTKSLTDSQANRDRLLVVYEKLVELQCMGGMAWNLKYEAPPDSLECRSYMEELRKLHPSNPVLICAENGIDSDLCSQAYEEQYISTQTAADGTVAVVDLEAKLSALEDEEQIADLSKQFNDASKDYVESKAANARKRALKIAAKILPMTCKFTRIIIEHQEPTGIKKKIDLFATAAPTGDPLHDLVVEYGSGSKHRADKAAAPPTPSPTAQRRGPFETGRAPAKPQSHPTAPLWRVRYLTYECMNLINKTLAIDPNFPPAVCYQQGFTAPECVAAKHRQRDIGLHKAEAARRGKRNANPKPKGGLGTF